MSVCEIKDCVNCGAAGEEIKSYPNGIKRMRCSNCGQVWQTLDLEIASQRIRLQLVHKTPACPVCGKESGYPGGGICARCYKAGRLQDSQRVQQG